MIFTLCLSVLHGLAGAAWFGAMFYSLTVLQPRAAAFFDKPAQFEEFIAAVSHGARWKVLSAFAIVGLSGFGLLALLWPASASPVWWTLIGVKIVLFLTALGVFIHTSWRLWPARILALVEEIPGYQRKFGLVGRTMIALIGLALALGIAAHRL